MKTKQTKRPSKTKKLKYVRLFRRPLNKGWRVWLYDPEYKIYLDCQPSENVDTPEKLLEYLLSLEREMEERVKASAMGLWHRFERTLL